MVLQKGGKRDKRDERSFFTMQKTVTAIIITVATLGNVPRNIVYTKTAWLPDEVVEEL